MSVKAKPATKPSRKPASKSAAAKAIKVKRAARKPSVHDSYDRVKHFGGAQYTGMQVGRSHKWYYDKGEWKDVKITPDLWSVSYSVTKRRAGKAPKGSGAAVGTGYHWFIVAHQQVLKLNEDDYSTRLSGFKFKLAHKRAAKGTWSASASAQKKRAVQFLRDMIAQIEEAPLLLEFEHNGVTYKGEATPVTQTWHDGRFDEFVITLNNEHAGIARRLSSGWKIEQVEDKKFVKAIGEQIDLHG